MVRYIRLDFDLNCLYHCMKEKPLFFPEIEEFPRWKYPQNSSSTKSLSCGKHLNSEIQQKMPINNSNLYLHNKGHERQYQSFRVACVCN